jgi:hypothetical protein
MSFTVPFGTPDIEITGEPLPHHLNDDEKADADTVVKARNASDRIAAATFIFSPCYSPCNSDNFVVPSLTLRPMQKSNRKNSQNVKNTLECLAPPLTVRLTYC